MPRSHCHFALGARLAEVIGSDIPDIGELIDRERSAFFSGTIAPDAVRYFSDLGKFGTHFYLEERKETWGRSVSGMFEAHPGLSDPGSLEDSEIAMLIGYISHLTVDESFRDTVTYQLHGMEKWRPVTKGLWSLVDELHTGHEGLVEILASYACSDVGFIAGDMVRQYLDLVGPTANKVDPWDVEAAFLRLVGDLTPEGEAKAMWSANRSNATDFMDESRRQMFVEKALEVGLDEVRAFVNGGYCKMPCT